MRATRQPYGVVSPARIPAWDWNFTRWSQFYAPYRSASLLSGLTLLVRTTQPAPAIAWAATVARDPDAPVTLTSAATANELLDTMIRPRRFESWVFGAFTVAALITVGAGVLGLVAMSSARRRHEIGVRMTLGASRRGIVRLITREQVAAVLTGLVLGAAAALAESLAIHSYIYGLQPFDPRIWIVTAALVLAVALTGIALPAVRASRVDPTEVLRAE
jgi:ABC-type antimicrobial peptide transport system permease subunit